MFMSCRPACRGLRPRHDPLGLVWHTGLGEAFGGFSLLGSKARKIPKPVFGVQGLYQASLIIPLRSPSFQGAFTHRGLEHLQPLVLQEALKIAAWGVPALK